MKKTILTGVAIASLPLTTNAALTWTLDTGTWTNRSIVDVADDGLATTYSGTFSFDGGTTAAGTWSLDVEFTTPDGVNGDNPTLEWLGAYGTANYMIGAITGGEALSFSARADRDGLIGHTKLTFKTTTDLSIAGTETITGSAYGIGFGDGRENSDWVTGTLTTGGTYVADSDGTHDASYDSGTGVYNGHNNGRPENSDWYVKYATDTEIIVDVGAQASDSHAFGFEVITVPEPSSTLLLGLGGLGLILRRRK